MNAQQKAPQNAAGLFVSTPLNRSEWLLRLEVALCQIHGTHDGTWHAHEQALGGLAQAATLNPGTAFAGNGHENLLI
jgi:hypothetical protein